MHFSHLHLGAFVFVVVILAIWEAIWKVISLWHAGRNNQLGCFLMILILGTTGSLPIVYLLRFQKEVSLALI